jgi:hypothetical protein
MGRVPVFRVLQLQVDLVRELGNVVLIVRREQIAVRI